MYATDTIIPIISNLHIYIIIVNKETEMLIYSYIIFHEGKHVKNPREGVIMAKKTFIERTVKSTAKWAKKNPKTAVAVGGGLIATTIGGIASSLTFGLKVRKLQNMVPQPQPAPQPQPQPAPQSQPQSQPQPAQAELVLVRVNEETKES